MPQASNDTYVRAELVRVSVSVVSDEVVSAS
jgi:hypothetical protein